MYVLILLAVANFASAQTSGPEFFEKRIRPVLVEKCYACHSSKMKSPMGGLTLETPEGTRKVLTPGDAAGSRLLRAIRYTDTALKMPPAGKLSEAEIAAFEKWIAEGAVDPRASTPGMAAKPSVERGRQWWAFQPPSERTPPAVKSKSWPRKKIDAFVLAKLEAGGVPPSPETDRRTLIRRVSYDLTGLPPAPEEVDAFVNAASPRAYEELVERLLASPRYGERWGRYWLDVARWAEDNPTSEATNQPYPLSWQYRDWIIEAVRKDLPYDLFVKRQLAADLMPGFERTDMRALGYLGTAPIYHKDARLSKEVIETLASDDWDEKVDGISRGVLGLSVACARCHDHKFDPITTKDYHALAGVFASLLPVKRPMVDIDAETERRFAWMQDRIQRLEYLTKLLSGEPGTDPEGSKRRVAKWKLELARLKEEIPKVDAPLTHAVYDAGTWIDGSDPDVTTMDIRPGSPRDLTVFIGGNVARPGEVVPRRFLSVLSKGEGEPFVQGAGRLELANAIFAQAAPLAARVWVNRVWAWHFGKPLVGTPSDFGTTGDAPTHPELLDDLAARFMANGWSLKWLHREIVVSAAYRQSSQPREAGMQADPANRLLWRMNPRRLDFEAFRDSLLVASGELQEKGGGASSPLDDRNLRRTVYARVSRGRLDTLFTLYDFPTPSQHSPGREITTTPLQQLFVMNSEYMRARAAGLAGRVPDSLPLSDQVRRLYRLAFAREPSPKELDLGASYLRGGEEQSRLRYAQALLSTNEFLFWE